MVAVKMTNFGGMVPAVDDRLLPASAASLNSNTWVYSGALEGFRQPVSVFELVNPFYGKAFRVPIEYYDKDHIPDSYWLEFINPDTDVIQSPVVGDSFERFYWAATNTEPMYNTKARIATGDPGYLLGVPAPTVAPGGSVAGGIAPIESRAYVYTWVSAYGEESPPSPPFLLSGNASGTWNMTFTAIGAVATNRNIAYTRIYRTITGTSGSTAFYFVAEIAVATLAYADTVSTIDVAAANILSSTFYEPPPTDMVGIIAMPNGITAGFRENEVLFSEPYKPHAWPSPYALAIEGKVVGLGVIGQSLIVLTTGSPYSISGVNPANMSVSRMAFTEPCLSRGSIVSTPIGVAYASPNGLAIAVPGRVEVVTRKLINKDKWLDQENFLNVPTLRATAVNGGYYCWGSVGGGTFDADAFEELSFSQEDYGGAYQGAFIDLSDPRVGYTKLSAEAATFNCYTDSWTGETFLIRDGQVYWLDLGPNRNHEPYLWRSKVMETPNQRSFGAMRIYHAPLVDTPELPFVANTDAVQTLAVTQWGIVRVYADGELKFTRELRTSGEIMRLPSGFKATFWEVEVEARVQIKSIELATTAKELGTV